MKQLLFYCYLFYSGLVINDQLFWINWLLIWKKGWIMYQFRLIIKNLYLNYWNYQDATVNCEPNLFTFLSELQNSGAISQRFTGKGLQLNWFFPNAPFLYHLKTSEILKVFLCFQGIEKECIGNEWVNQILTPSHCFPLNLRNAFRPYFLNGISESLPLSTSNNWCSSV